MHCRRRERKKKNINPAFFFLFLTNAIDVMGCVAVNAKLKKHALLFCRGGDVAVIQALKFKKKNCHK